jgi:hypothetical protein|tara:strand:- start:151 stop:561 length:411 start_codon:yes stop_codon:yes gene_type:complete
MSELIELLKEIKSNKEAAAFYRDEANRLEYEAIKELQEMGIKKADLGDSEATLVPSKADVNSDMLRPLLEHPLIADKLIDSGAYTPAHTKEIDVPEKWNLTHLKGLKQYGGNEVEETIDNATTRRYTIKFKDKGAS